MGAWKNFDEMEESLTMNELNILLGTIREEKRDERTFYAMFKGVDLNKYYGNPIEDKRREIERRAAEKRVGAVELERQELAEFGLNFETD